MKKLVVGSLIAASSLLNLGCGVVDGIQSNCQGSDLQAGCDLIFGYKDRQQDSRIDQTEDLLFALSREIEKRISSGDERLQLEINALQAKLTELATRQIAVSLIDPCEDMPGQYDEVLMRIEDGRLVAYFEQGGKRYLTILQPNVAYQTTDAQACRFSINEHNQVVYP